MSTLSLKEAFKDDEWFKFTDDSIDEKQSAEIFKNVRPPSNSPHATSIEGIKEGAKRVWSVNSDTITALFHK